ncbi:MAG TPA: glycosyltransferase, partial [Thermodesulfobacteriota bacterium]|nr:glycosyltransferase [Thermodesulfobacteriota bacterium]
MTRRCIEAVRRNTGTPHTLVLIDNGSNEETRRYLESLAADPAFPGLLIRNEENLGYIKAVNQGLSASRAPFVCLLNNDVVVTPGWLGRMIGFADSRPDAGLVSCLQNNDPGRHMPADLEEWARRQAGRPGEWEELDHCTGGCLLIKREVIDRIGFLDEDFGPGYWEDNDYSRRAQSRGFGCFRLLDTCVWHDVGVSFAKTGSRKEKEEKNKDLYYSRWGSPLRIIYPVNEGVDFRRARFHQIFQTAHALARGGCEVDLIVGKNRVDPSRALSHYGLWPHQNLRIHPVPMLRREEARVFRVSWDMIFRWALFIKMRELLRSRSYQAVYLRHL